MALAWQSPRLGLDVKAAQIAQVLGWRSPAFDTLELAAWRKAFFWDPLHSFRVASHAEQSKSVSALGQHIFGSGCMERFRAWRF